MVSSAEPLRFGKQLVGKVSRSRAFGQARCGNGQAIMSGLWSKWRARDDAKKRVRTQVGSSTTRRCASGPLGQISLRHGDLPSFILTSVMQPLHFLRTSSSNLRRSLLDIRGALEAAAMPLPLLAVGTSVKPRPASFRARRMAVHPLTRNMRRKEVKRSAETG